MKDLRGWLFAGVGGFDHYFTTFIVNPFVIEWEELLNEWLEELLESSYSFLIDSDVSCIITYQFLQIETVCNLS